MATMTTNYGFTKPSYGDNADIAVINSNMDKIDAKMKEIEGAGGGASTWAEVSNKPFETVGSGLSVDESGALNATGGGSGGGGSYTETLLANGTFSKGSSISLSDDYDKFDELVFVCKNTKPDGYIANHIVKKSTIDHVVSNNYMLELYGYSTFFVTLTFADKKTINVDGSGVIYKVIGVNF